MVLARFLPRDEQFFDFFRDAAANAVEVAAVLAEVVEQTDDVERRVRRLRDLEHRGDEITHQIFSALNSTFVTPLDRDDIRGLAAVLDDFVDDLEEAGRRIWLYRLTEPTEPARLFVRILCEQSAILVEAMSLLEDVGKQTVALKRLVVEMHRLENEADDALSHVLSTLYDPATDIPSLVRCIHWGELYGLLEDATDRAEDIADMMEGIILKHG